jgi:hypothetical protein
MVMLSFLSGVIGLLVAGYTMLFSGEAHTRLSGVGAIGMAGLVVGGLLTAQLNGGRPYGYDVSIGLDQWKRIDRSEPALPLPAPEPQDQDGPPIA